MFKLTIIALPVFLYCMYMKVSNQQLVKTCSIQTQYGLVEIVWKIFISKDSAHI